MKKQYLILTLLVASMAISATAQTRYVDAIYTDAQIEVTSDIKYGTNVDILKNSDFSNQQKVGTDLYNLNVAIATQQPFAAHYYNPADTTSVVKITDLHMDIYKPKTSEDATTDRPVIVYLHTGNFLPPVTNGSPNGIKTDSSAIVLCTEWAKRGYVAVSVNYRLGWNPVATSVEARKSQLLNAVYRAIHDAKHAVRMLKDEHTTHGIDTNKIALYGEGTGAYVALAYETLDKNEEMELPKFREGGVGDSYINRANVGEIDGSGGNINLYQASNTTTDISAVITAGGALADTSWLEAGNVPMIAFHCVRDAFAPFGEGTVIVPTTNQPVVDVQGANVFIQKANALGNNDIIKDIAPNDPYTIAAEANYGETVEYIYDDPADEITINTGVKGLFPVLLPVADEELKNQASPWQWWDPESAFAKDFPPAGGGATAHQASSQSNPDMSPAKGRAYVDTILNYMCPRIALINGDITLNSLNVENVLAPSVAKMYPNPATNEVTISVDAKYNVTAISIYDISGREVIAQDASNTATISLEGLESGYYFVNVFTTDGTVTNKLIKE